MAIGYRDVIERVEESSDIAGFLLPLYELAKETGAGVVVELGVRRGESTHALLAAVNETGGHLYSVDTAPCTEIREKLVDEPNWTFIERDDLSYAGDWSKPIDFLFIDTSHTYDHTLRELQLWGRFVRKGGIIALHDTMLHKPVLDAVTHYIGAHGGEEGYKFKNYEKDYGLGVIRK